MTNTTHKQPLFWAILGLSLLSFSLGLHMGGMILFQWHSQKLQAYIHTGEMHYAGETYDITLAVRMQGLPKGRGIITSAWYLEDEHD